MHTTQFHNDSNAGFAARVIAGIRALFGGKSTLTVAFATACANELRGQHGLTTLVAMVSRLSRRERAARLIQAARIFRGDRATVGVADTLCRMAKRPALFRAVSRALDAAPSSNVTPFPAPLPFAQAA